jgi:hypothetical protein
VLDINLFWLFGREKQGVSLAGPWYEMLTYTFYKQQLDTWSLGLPQILPHYRKSLM